MGIKLESSVRFDFSLENGDRIIEYVELEWFSLKR